MAEWRSLSSKVQFIKATSVVITWLHRFQIASFSRFCLFLSILNWLWLRKDENEFPSCSRLLDYRQSHSMTFHYRLACLWIHEHVGNWFQSVPDKVCASESKSQSWSLQRRSINVNHTTKAPLSEFIKRCHRACEAECLCNDLLFKRQAGLVRIFVSEG